MLACEGRTSLRCQGPERAVPTAAGNFGKITSTNVFYTPRDIQLALKFVF